MTEPHGPYDLAVIGGGINGAGIAFDAAGRGARVLLLEKGDLASGTSSASTKLIHGGLRYLEHYEFALVREALKERETLWRMAPHAIRPLRLVLPVSGGQRPALLLRAGLFLYDHMGGRRLLPATSTIRLGTHPAGAALQKGGLAFEYSDGWADDSRLVVLNARGAAERGATVLTRHPLTSAVRGGDHWQLTAGGKQFSARALVNAAGPGVNSVIEAAAAPALPPLRLVRGSHIVVDRLFDHDFGYFLQIGDGRIFFALPFEEDFTLIGTTDVDHKSGDPIAASEAEIDYLIDAANGWFRRKLDRADVRHSFSGVRPLVAAANGKPEEASRGYRFDLSPHDLGAPLLTVLGGKLTSYRQLGEKALDLLASRLPGLGPAWTAQASLPGGDFPVDGAAALADRLGADYPFLDRAEALRIVRAYGTDAWRWLGEARTRGDLGRDYGAGLSEAEVNWMRQQEWAMSADDILWRRSKLGLRLGPDAVRQLSGNLGA
ncbi:glycerol-3-phosphate dehydrogenase [Sphingomonas humi]|uniref:Glycerol-3-phosphate dehydrogenase n=1 Tax=Sphingomonas humi TaxID=335630 RepID=A0ABP7S8W6_9SPHN